MQIIKTDFFGGPVWLVGSRIWCCHCCGVGHCYSVTGPGTPLCCGHGKKKKIYIYIVYINILYINTSTISVTLSSKGVNSIFEQKTKSHQ